MRMRLETIFSMILYAYHVLNEKVTCWDSVKTCIIFVRFEFNDWLLCMSIQFFSCEYSYDCIFFRTFFKPCWDYIDAYDYMNMIEALGLHHLTKKPKTKCIISLVKSLSLNEKTFSFMNLSKEYWALKKNKFLYPNL